MGTGEPAVRSARSAPPKEMEVPEYSGRFPTLRGACVEHEPPLSRERGADCEAGDPDTLSRDSGGRYRRSRGWGLEGTVAPG